MFSFCPFFRATNINFVDYVELTLIVLGLIELNNDWLTSGTSHYKSSIDCRLIELLSLVVNSQTKYVSSLFINFHCSSCYQHRTRQTSDQRSNSVALSNKTENLSDDSSVKNAISEYSWIFSRRFVSQLRRMSSNSPRVVSLMTTEAFDDDNDDDDPIKWKKYHCCTSSPAKCN